MYINKWVIFVGNRELFLHLPTEKFFRFFFDGRFISQSERADNYKKSERSTLGCHNRNGGIQDCPYLSHVLPPIGVTMC